jgi:7-cyano-7-deazaguanine synthase
LEKNEMPLHEYERENTKMTPTGNLLKALVVLSGGQDSTTCLYFAISQFGRHNVRAVTYDYGQRHEREIEAAILIAAKAQVEHNVVTIGPILRSTSPLVSYEKLETYPDYETMDAIIGNRIEKTFVPMRNALFLTLAANHAVYHGCTNIITGVCQQDNANYPDCRASFISEMECMINAALGHASDVSPGYIKILTPLMNMSKAQSIKYAQSLDGCMEALAYSHTAYDGVYPPVGKDHASTLRARGFEEAGVPDPLVVRAWTEGLMELPLTLNYQELRGGG